MIRREGKGILVVLGFIYPGQRLYISCLVVFVWLSFDIINAKKDDHLYQLAHLVVYDWLQMVINCLKTNQWSYTAENTR